MTQQDRLNRAFDILADKGYRQTWHGVGPNDSDLSIYVGPKGVVMLQDFRGNDGIEFYFQAKGNSWESIETAL